MAKAVQPDSGPEKFSRDRLFGWFFRRLEVPPWGRFFFYLFFLAIVLVASLGWYALLHPSGKSDATDSKIEGVRQDLAASVERSEARLNSRIDNVFSQLVQELIKHIKAEVSSGEAAESRKDVSLVSNLISISRRNGLRAPPGFFNETVKGLDEIASDFGHQPVVTADLRQIRFELAEYRSALQERPYIPKDLRTIDIPPEGAIITPKMLGGRAVYRISSGLTAFPHVHYVSEGAVINGTGIPVGVDILNPKSRSLSDDIIVQGLIFVGASQTLDGIAWSDTVFVNT